jgi:hypothetical protein
LFEGLVLRFDKGMHFGRRTCFLEEKRNNELDAIKEKRHVLEVSEGL